MVSIDDVRHVLGAIIKCALVDVRSGDKAQRAEAEAFLDRVWPAWRTRSNQMPPKARHV